MSRPDTPVDPESPATEASALRRFRRWFWRPPRAHGEIESERRVSFLELFSDLVYVVVIAQAARELSGSVSLRGYVEFLVVFGVIWVAWANGTLYYELHGREDGRTRTYVFIQMAILTLLAVFTGKAASDTGTAFALVVVAFLVVMTWLWYTVRRQDRPEYMANTARYLAAMVVSIVVLAISAVLPTDARLAAWAAFTIGWIVLMLLFGWRSRQGSVTGIVATDAMVERFDLLIIIVLGEVVTGVVNGLAGAEQDPLTLATGFVALLVGFGLWWIFFDVGGRRLPRRDGLVSEPLDDGAPANRRGDRRGRGGDDRPDRARARAADPGRHRLAADRFGRARADRARPRHPDARRLPPPCRDLSAARPRDGRRFGAGPARRLVAAGGMAAGAAPGGDPRGRLGLCGRPAVQDWGVGRRGLQSHPPRSTRVGWVGREGGLGQAS